MMQTTNVMKCGGFKEGISALVYYIYCELMKLLRMPMFSIPTLLFPILFFAMFGMPYVDLQMHGINAGRYMMASFGTYAVMSVAMSSFSASVATERGTGWNRFLRTTPLNAPSYLVGKFSMAIVYEFVTLLAFLTFGATVGGVTMPFAMWSKLALLLLLGVFPFIALGFFLGYVSGPNSSTIVANLIFFPMAFASGLFMPLQMLPKFIQKLAPYLPSYNVAELGWTTLGAQGGRAVWIDIIWISVYTAFFLVLALIVYRRDQGRTFS